MALESLNSTARKSSIRRWFPPPKNQFSVVRQLNHVMKWGFKETDFPASIPELKSNSPTGVLLLAVYLPDKDNMSGIQRTFEEFWRLIQAPPGYKKWRHESTDGNPKHLRLVSGIEHNPGIRWVEFDLNCEVQSELDRPAHAEVLISTILCPEWATMWNGINEPFIELAGYQCIDNDNNCIGSPHLHRWDEDKKICFYAIRSDCVDYWAAPVVRELA